MMSGNVLYSNSELKNKVHIKSKVQSTQRNRVLKKKLGFFALNLNMSEKQNLKFDIGE